MGEGEGGGEKELCHVTDLWCKCESNVMQCGGVRGWGVVLLWMYEEKVGRASVH